MGTAAPPPAATQAAGGEESLDGAAVDEEEVPLDLARPLIAGGHIVAVLPDEQAHRLFWLAESAAQQRGAAESLLWARGGHAPGFLGSGWRCLLQAK
jgi:hypothetical protein